MLKIVNYLLDMFFRILGPTALKELAQKQEPLPPADKLRPTYSLSMRGLIVCFTGFKVRDELVRGLCRFFIE